MVGQVLVVPDDVPGVGIERQRRVVVQVLQVAPPQHELRGGRRNRRAHVDQVQLGIVARHHPGAHVAPVLERHAAPGFVARLAGRRHQPRAPQLRAGPRVVGRDDARLRPCLRDASAPGNDLAVGDDRAGRLMRRMHLVVDDPRLPRQPSGGGLQGEDVAVGARVDDQVAVDGEVAVPLGKGRDDVLREILGAVAAVLPQQVAGDGVDGLDDVARVRHVHHAAVHQRRALLAARGKRARPDHAQLAHVVAVDLVERAVAPAVERPPPHQPVFRGGILEHGVGDRCKPIRGLRRRNAGRCDEQQRRRHHGPAPQAQPPLAHITLPRPAPPPVSCRAPGSGRCDRHRPPGPPRSRPPPGWRRCPG